MIFTSNILGEFNEVFKWVLKDTNEYISLNFKGNVIAPTFEFEFDKLDFQKVSFNFDYSKMIKIKNISKVPFVFKLRVPGDELGLMQEFKITPNSKQIEPSETTLINIVFTPGQSITYETNLVLDIENVGENMASIPIRAECIVPQVKIQPNNLLDFGEVYIM